MANSDHHTFVDEFTLYGCKTVHANAIKEDIEAVLCAMKQMTTVKLPLIMFSF